MEPKARRQQETFRTLLDCLARPGSTGRIQPHQQYGTIFYDATVEALMTVLDAEVSWYTPEADVATREELEIRTLSRYSDISDADYIVLKNDCPEEIIKWCFNQAKTGNEINPQHSATLFVEVDALNSGDSWEITGPGVPKPLTLSLTKSSQWMPLRKQAIIYPCGWELFLIDARGQVMGLPRTTHCREVD